MEQAVADQLVDWRNACEEVHAVARGWAEARANRCDAYALFTAALAREEEAALIYQDLLDAADETRTAH